MAQEIAEHLGSEVEEEDRPTAQGASAGGRTPLVAAVSPDDRFAS